MTLCGDVVHEIRRLGGSLDEPELRYIVWPTGRFSWSLARAQAEFPHYDINDESEMEVYFHPVRALEFIQEDSGFWVNWEHDFEETDTVRFAPLAKDEAFYYLLDRSSAKENPDVYCVSHDAVSDAPYHPKEYKLKTFLRILE